MSEEQIRAVFEHVEAVRQRWSRDFSYISDFSYAALGDDGEIVFLACGYDGSERDSLPLLAFVDYDTALTQAREHKAREQALWELQRETRERQEWERLQRKYGAG